MFIFDRGLGTKSPQKLTSSLTIVSLSQNSFFDGVFFSRQKRKRLQLLHLRSRCSKHFRTDLWNSSRNSRKISEHPTWKSGEATDLLRSNERTILFRQRSTLIWWNFKLLPGWLFSVYRQSDFSFVVLFVGITSKLDEILAYDFPKLKLKETRILKKS